MSVAKPKGDAIEADEKAGLTSVAKPEGDAVEAKVEDARDAAD